MGELMSGGQLRKWMRPPMVALVAAAIIAAGCHSAPENLSRHRGELKRVEFALQEISTKEASSILSQLGLGTVSATGGKAIAVTARPDALHKAQVVLNLVDSPERFVVTTLAPAAAARTVPSNAEIARLLGNLEIGTFGAPPRRTAKVRAIIDIHNDALIAIAPARVRRELAVLASLGPDGSSEVRDEPALLEEGEVPTDARAEAPDGTTERPSEPKVTGKTGPSQQSLRAPASRRVRVVQPLVNPDEPIETLPKPGVEAAVVSPREPAGGKGPGKERVIDSLSREPVSADSNKIVVSGFDSRDPASLAHADEVLRLDLPQQLEMIQLLDLVGEYLELDYLLLESVLKFKGFAMTCHRGNLVTIVPAADALRTNPELIDSQNRDVEPGDMVVTSIFELHNVGVPAVSTLLQNMQLSLAVTPIEGSQSLIVTCYAHQVERIERLLSVVDRPGRPKEFRFRQLKYTMADSLTKKIRVLVAELGTASLATGTVPTGSPSRPGVATVALNRAASRSGGPAPSGDKVYLDADERTNRILMIGYSEQLAAVESLVDALDVAQQDLRVLKVYEVQHVEAEEIKRKLQELEIIGGSARARASAGKITSAEVADGAVTAEPVVVVLEATNSLVINATEEQHAQVEAMMDYLDAEVRVEAIPYEIYFLENQDPENVAQVLEEIIHETVQDKEGKLQKILRNTEDQIVIVPDKNTFSLIVYATRKNQEWISKLIETLDRRRPQVLIDVTLVEIRKTDEFNYDLNLISSLPDLLETGGQTGQFFVDENTTVIEKLLQSERAQFADFEVNSGQGTGFYADRHINALLTAVQTKNYGRVLAKPKVLVNDNEKGVIKTTDTTYVATKSSIPVTSGSAGQQNTLIETAVKYESYDAGITLEITPHISDRLLRLEMTLTRSDFTNVTPEKPPDATSSDINTIVTVPDGSTIILGGMLKLNQSKAGSKVPILGDLPLVGGAFRSVSNSDIQSKLYVFVRAEIIRPADDPEDGGEDLKRISEQNREAFEQHEHEFQDYESWPGIESEPLEPVKALDAR
jgi:general secretion pathway protein D